jgi:hypothetical protein
MYHFVYMCYSCIHAHIFMLQFERYTAVHKLRQGHMYDHSNSGTSSTKQGIPTSKKQKTKQEEMTIWEDYKLCREIHIPLYKVIYIYIHTTCIYCTYLLHVVYCIARAAIMNCMYSNN